MKIWHDNTGKGDKASWFLKYVIIHDLQTREKFYFICQNWLAVEKSDGQLVRELFVASNRQKTELKYLMKKQVSHYIIDHHLWLSVFYRPVQSSFTRLDRVTCCFVFYYISMFLNIVCYGNLSLSFSNTKYTIDFSLFSINFQQVRSFKLCKSLLDFIDPLQALFLELNLFGDVSFMVLGLSLLFHLSIPN